MPTECERSVTSPATTATINSSSFSTTSTEIKDTLKSTNLNENLTPSQSMMESGDMSTSQTSTTSNGSSSCNGGRKTSITSPDPTAYVAKARVTRPTPPPPPYNPMQFVQIKPCNLYQTAQEQLKKAEEVKKIKEIRKEEPEDWQNNLDNWKSSRRKRVEHIIDRVVEVKKLELEEHDRTRRKSKTFSEMIEERGERSGGRGLNKLASLAVYAEDEANDLSDLGIGTSSASGKSSLSEDYDNNSVMSDNAAELDKAINNSTNPKPATTESTTREYISSPGYETSSSTAPASSPDPCEYTYEGAIQDYKQRVSRAAASGLTSVALNKLTSQQQQQQTNSKESTPDRPVVTKETAYPPRRGSKIEDRLMGFEVQSPSEECVEKNKVDVPKIDISKRKEIFEAHEQQNNEPKSQYQSATAAAAGGSSAGVPRVTLRDRFKVQETVNNETLCDQPKKELKRLSGDITSIKERLQSLEQQQQQNLVNGANGATKATANKLVDIPVPPLKERLSSLQNAVTKEEVRKPPVVLVDARQLEIMKSEEEKAQLSLKETKKDLEALTEIQKEINHPNEEEIDKDDSGIHTADDVELEERNQAVIMKKEQELKLNAAIEALAKEEKQLSEAANAVNQIEAEFEELTLGSASLAPLANNTNASATPITNDHMEYSVSSTNPQTTSCYSPNYNDNNDSSSNNSLGSGSLCNSSSVNVSQTVKGLDFKSASNLRRKPTNEMVHAKNLLKIFKETFQNDIELDENEVSEEHETKNIKEDLTQDKENDLSLNIKTQIYENSKNVATMAKGGIYASSEVNSPQTPLTTPNAQFLAGSSLTNSPSMIPLSKAPQGKPPMSPLTIRSTTKFVANSPPSSPSLVRKNDSQFSINGRVEIFNSKTMTSSSSPKSVNPVKPTTPTMTTKKTQLPYINAPKTTQSNSIVLQQQLPQEATTKQQQQQRKTSTTVIEPLSTITTTTTTVNTSTSARQNEEKLKQLKSMPSQQMVNEPQTIKLKEGETYHHQHQQHHSHQQQQQQLANHNNEELVKQQQPEVVVCAPPITIVNPDELPKPNTVKNLSSCFQQQSDIGKVKATSKPLTRTRIPQATPPPSPLLPKHHTCYSSQNSTEESNKLSPSEEKKLSIISSSSNSSTSTASTVIDNSKKLSIISNSSSTSGDITPSLVKTNAQVHRESKDEQEGDNVKEPQANDTKESKGFKEEKKATIKTGNFEIDKMEEANETENCKQLKEKPAKTLDKSATQALVQETINTDKQARTFILNSEDLKCKTTEKKSLTPLKLNLNKTPDSDTNSNTPLNISETPKEKFLQSPTPKSPTASTPLPYNTPLAPLHSPKSELFKTTTPLVVSTLYDKYQPTPLPPSNQRTPLAPLKPTKPNVTTPNLIIPAELPALPNCPPNESTLYKLASSAPHSPTTPQSRSEKDLPLVFPNTPPSHTEKNLAIDSALCSNLLTSLAATPEVFQRQHTVEEDVCQKVDKKTLPFHQGSTGFKDISKSDIKRCDGLTPTTAPKLQGSTQRQKTVEEELCQKVDIHSLPDGKQQSITGYKSISPTEIRKCDNFFNTNSAKPSCNKTNPKPNSPIAEAREAHSKALIETCEKIIAEERLASTHMKSSLPSTPVNTPLMQRRSKIPKPITSCCKASESLNEADLTESNSPSPVKEDNNGVIARMHVVETQIKVTTSTPPSSPKVAANKSPASPQPPKKTKNIFDFLKKNFGGHSHKDETQTQKQDPTGAENSPLPAQANQVLVLSEEELKDLEKVHYDEVHTYDNSKFYIPLNEMGYDDDDASNIPPPLPKTPAPVNIEITRKVITDEILEDGKTEKDLTKEIDDLLDDELNKLNHEIEKLEKAGEKQ